MSSLPNPLGQPWLSDIARLLLYPEAVQICSYENQLYGRFNFISFVPNDWSWFNQRLLGI